MASLSAPTWSLCRKAASVTVEEVMAAVGEVVVCIECCGRRFADADFTPMQGWADACSGAGVILGARCPARSVSTEQLASLTARLLVNGAEVARGSAAECPLGSPMASLTGCANHLNGRGLGLKAGQLVITGNLARCKTDLAPGLHVEAQLGWDGDACGLGITRARVVQGAGSMPDGTRPSSWPSCRL